MSFISIPMPETVELSFYHNDGYRKLVLEPNQAIDGHYFNCMGSEGEMSYRILPRINTDFISSITKSSETTSIPAEYINEKLGLNMLTEDEYEALEHSNGRYMRTVTRTREVQKTCYYDLIHISMSNGDKFTFLYDHFVTCLDDFQRIELQLNEE